MTDQGVDYLLPVHHVFCCETWKNFKKRAASGCWHYIESRANIKWALEEYGLRALASFLTWQSI